MSLLAAIQFLTILPVKRGFSAEETGRSTAYFPVVGLLIGGVLALLSFLLGMVLPSAVVNALLVVAMVALSGGIHMDGLVDTCDGIAGHGTPQERWERMRDSRAGGFGVIGAALLVLVKFISLNSVPQSVMLFTLVMAPVISRWAMVYAISAYPYARASGLGSAFKQATGWRQLTVATVITVIIAGGCFRLAGLAALLAVWLVTLVTAIYLKRKLAGLTGDTYGAVNELAETAVFIIVSLLAFSHWLI